MTNVELEAMKGACLCLLLLVVVVVVVAKHAFWTSNSSVCQLFYWKYESCVLISINWSLNEKTKPNEPKQLQKGVATAAATTAATAEFCGDVADTVVVVTRGQV